MSYCLQIDKVNKVYDSVHAVKDLSLSIPEASIFGLLGPNGAGKTSLIRMITTITSIDEGRIFLFGKEIDQNTPNKIGYLPEERGLYKKMKVYDHILYLALLKGMPKAQAVERIHAWLDRFQLTEKAKSKVEELSKGMQQKVQFITTVVHEPPLVILDEPFSGLDPINTNLIKDEIARLKQQGTTIIFSTHRMEQVEEICEEIALINKGQVILRGTVDAAKQAYKDNIFKISFENGTSISPFLGTILNQDAKSITFQAESQAQAQSYLKQVINQGVSIVKFEEVLPTLNEIFIKKVQNNG